MAFEAGKSGNPSGRPVGSKNRTTKELQFRISEFVGDNIEKIQEDFDRMSPVDKFKVITTLLPFVVPKLQDSDSEIKDTPRKPLPPYVTMQYHDYFSTHEDHSGSGLDYVTKIMEERGIPPFSKKNTDDRPDAQHSPAQ